ncbi:hypothetical protein [Kineosporia sp. R_H_3]|uniref:hypothetical protein n=1 Tax=Kineosporia sp. R_H_3 TaxID=1961848 RepID=UPI00117BADBC|nr:hypothetical protein [Kineosporia sp. R_H_3]
MVGSHPYPGRPGRCQETALDAVPQAAPQAVTAPRRAPRALAVAAVVVAGVWAVGAGLGGDLSGGAADPVGAAEPGSAAAAVAAADVRVASVAQVVEPDGGRAPAPDDLVGWLQRHPQVTVLGVRRVRGGGWGSGGFDSWRGVRAVSVDYELAAPGATTPPLRRFVGLPLFCAGGDGGCTRLVPGVRVRTTFVTDAGEGTVTTVESRWPASTADGVGLIPEPLRTEHRTVLIDVVRQTAGASDGA